MSAFNLSIKKAVTGYIGWWLFWIFIQTILLHRLGWSWEIALTDAAVSNLLLAVVGFITQNTYKFYRPWTTNKLQLLGYAIALTIAYLYVLRYLLMQIYSLDIAYLNFLEVSIPLRFTFALVMIALMTVTSWLFFLMKEQQENSARKEEAERLTKEAELYSLRQQLQPHFLFNSLNSISSLAGSKPEEARRMIQQLSDFLRGTLKNEEQQVVKLAEEIKHLNLYLEIEKVRFGHRLKTEIVCDEKCYEMTLPSLLLQPLVENAIKFGLYDTLDDITIYITSKAVKNNLVIEIKNPFDAATSKPKKGLGFGLTSVQRRLHLIYGRQDLLKVEQRENTFSSTLIIPQ